MNFSHVLSIRKIILSEILFRKAHAFRLHLEENPFKHPLLTPNLWNQPPYNDPLPFEKVSFTAKLEFLEVDKWVPILKEHLKKVHEDKRPYVCPVCEKPSKRKKNLTSHLKTNSNVTSHKGGVLFCGSRKWTYFHGGIRKFSVISTDLGHKNSDGNGNIIFKRVGKRKLSI